MDKNLLSKLSAKYGAIKRARGCFLYTQSGARLVDLYRDEGRAILGFGYGKARLMMKNSIEKGFTTSYDYALPSNLKRALQELLPNYKFFCVRSAPVLQGANKIPVWMPWLDKNDTALKSDVIEVRPPFACKNFFVYGAKDASSVERAQNVIDFAVNDAVPAPLVAAVTRAIYDLSNYIKSKKQEDFALYDDILCKYWHRKGAYLYPTVERAQYEAFFDFCLCKNVLISPCYDTPSIVPFDVAPTTLLPLVKTPFCNM